MYTGRVFYKINSQCNVLLCERAASSIKKTEEYKIKGTDANSNVELSRTAMYTVNIPF